MNISQELLEIIASVDPRGVAPENTPDFFRQCYFASISQLYNNSDEEDAYLGSPKVIHHEIYQLMMGLQEYLDVGQEDFLVGLKWTLDQNIGAKTEDLQYRIELLELLKGEKPIPDDGVAWTTVSSERDIEN